LTSTTTERIGMRDKNVAGILGLFFGWIGVHRFYLGQVGLGILYAILAVSGISFILGLIDAIIFFSMDKDAFDIKYNSKFFEAVPRERRNNRNTQGPPRRGQRRSGRDHRGEYRERSRRPAKPVQPPKPPPTKPRSNPYKKSGIEKYKEYDYDGAIQDFQKALEISPRDIAVHFNLACAYSLNEKAEKAFQHLDQAVRLGFDDFKRIKEHDALAYLRIQDDFEAFEQNTFRLPAEKVEQQLDLPTVDEVPDQTEQDLTDEDISPGSSELLEQLNKLSELRKKGLLTEEEFVVQKKKLLD
jgi:TM2 domain-containing membrane protein YozV